MGEKSLTSHFGLGNCSAWRSKTFKTSSFALVLLVLPWGPSLCGASTQGHAPSQGFHLRVCNMPSSGWMCAFRWHTQCIILCLSCRQKCYLPHPKNTENERNTCQVSKLWGDVTALYTYMLDQLRRRSSRSHQVWGIHALSQKYFVALDTQRRSVANPTAQKLICI